MNTLLSSPWLKPPINPPNRSIKIWRLAAGLCSHSRTYLLSPKAIRRVWAAVSAHPRSSLRELCILSSLSLTTVQVAMRYLHEMGYITSEPRATRARTIIIPFIDTGAKK
jgi:hypothetical protein